jgi:hypothetical protein
MSGHGKKGSATSAISSLIPGTSVKTLYLRVEVSVV